MQSWHTSLYSLYAHHMEGRRKQGVEGVNRPLPHISWQEYKQNLCFQKTLDYHLATHIFRPSYEPEYVQEYVYHSMKYMLISSKIINSISFYNGISIETTPYFSCHVLCELT